MEQNKFLLDLGRLGKAENIEKVLEVISNNVFEALKEEEVIEIILNYILNIVEHFKNNKDKLRGYIDLILTALGKRIINGFLDSNDEKIKNTFEAIGFEMFPVGYNLVLYVLGKDNNIKLRIFEKVSMSDMILEDLSEEDESLLDKIMSLIFEYYNGKISREELRKKINEILFGNA